MDLFCLAPSSAFVQSIHLKRAAMASDGDADGSPDLAANGSPNLAVLGRWCHSWTLLCHGRWRHWLSRSGRPWSSASLIPRMLLALQIWLSLIKKVTHNSASSFFYFLSPFLLYTNFYLFFVSVHGGLQPLTPSLKSTSNGGHRSNSRSCHDLRDGQIWHNVDILDLDAQPSLPLSL